MQIIDFTSCQKRCAAFYPVLLNSNKQLALSSRSEDMDISTIDLCSKIAALRTGGPMLVAYFHEKDINDPEKWPKDRELDFVFNGG